MIMRMNFYECSPGAGGRALPETCLPAPGSPPMTAAVFRERESFDSIDDAYFEDEYGCEDGLDIPFSDEPSKEVHPRDDPRKEREVLPKPQRIL